MVSSNNKIVLSRFFEQSNFEQMIMTRLIFKIFEKENIRQTIDDLNLTLSDLQFSKQKIRKQQTKVVQDGEETQKFVFRFVFRDVHFGESGEVLRPDKKGRTGKPEVGQFDKLGPDRQLPSGRQGRRHRRLPRLQEKRTFAQNRQI
jgi:hypothetical protein